MLEKNPLSKPHSCRNILLEKYGIFFSYWSHCSGTLSERNVLMNKSSVGNGLEMSVPAGCRMQEYLRDVFNPKWATMFIQQIKENEFLYTRSEEIWTKGIILTWRIQHSEFLWSKTTLGLFPQIEPLVLARAVGIKLIQMFTIWNLFGLSKYVLFLCFCPNIDIYFVIQKMTFFWNQNIGCKFTNLNFCKKHSDVSLAMCFTLEMS